MSLTVSPTQSQVFTALGDFLTAVLPAGMPVVMGQVNRVSEPPQPNFAVMWPLRFPRLTTNVDAFVDCAFTASIAGLVMTVTAVDAAFPGVIAVGRQVFGVGVADGTAVASLGTGSGGTGTYNLTASQTVASRTMAAGVSAMTQAAEWVVQLDVHGPAGADNAQIVSTAFRDDYAVGLFALSGLPVTPLYADDPRQTPFVNAEQAYEDRYSIDVHLQVDQTVSVGLQFFTSVDFTMIDVDAAYPAA